MDLLKTPRSVWRVVCHLWEWLKGPQARGLFAVVAVIALIFATYNSAVAKNDSAAAKKSSAAAASSSAAAEVTARKALISQNNHHQQSVEADKRIEEAETVISYEGGVITFLLGELSQGHVQTQQILAEVQGVQTELAQDVSAAVVGIKGGQAMINAAITFQNEQTCNIETHLGLTCSAPPPLPQT